MFNTISGFILICAAEYLFVMLYLPAAGYAPLAPLAPLAIPSVVSGAQKTVKDLQQMATADAEAIIDTIEELMQEASHGSGTATVTRLADPVLSKSSQHFTPGDLHSNHLENSFPRDPLFSIGYLLCSAATNTMLFLVSSALATLRAVLQATCKAASTKTQTCELLGNSYAQCLCSMGWQPMTLECRLAVMSYGTCVLTQKHASSWHMCSDTKACKLMAACWGMQGGKKRVGM